MDESYYQSAYEGEEIDESIGKVQDIFIKKTSVIPVEVGGTGQTTVQGIKDMLGLGSGGEDVIPISGGGTGATTAAKARENLGALSTTGTAAAATKLATARTIRTNLGSTSTASFDGTANITPGVTGILPQANGGTGASSLAAAIQDVIQQGGVGLAEVSTTGEGNTLFSSSSSFSLNDIERYYLVAKAVTKATGLHKIQTKIYHNSSVSGERAGIVYTVSNILSPESGNFFSSMEVNGKFVLDLDEIPAEKSDQTVVYRADNDQTVTAWIFLEAGSGFSVWVTGHDSGSSQSSSATETILKSISITYGNS